MGFRSRTASVGASACTFASALTLALGALATPALADTLTVPGDHASIQAAIDAAVDLDEVLVSPGTYVEAIDFLGKDIAVRSTDGALHTTIDGNGAGSTVSFLDNEGVNAVLEGFTITGGVGDLNPAGFPFVVVGGGVVVAGASPVIRCCTVRGNTADWGGGIFVVGDSAPYGQAKPLIENCVIEGNDALSGGGLQVQRGSPTVDGCLIRNNSATSGGGFLAVPGTSGDVNLVDTVIEGNTATSGAGGWTSTTSNVADIIMTRCRFLGNVASGPGGGLFMFGNEDGLFVGDSSQQVLACDFIGNQAARGGGLVFDADGFGSRPELDVHDCLLADNVANSVGFGGAIWANLDDAQINVHDSTLADNTASVSGGAMQLQGSSTAGSGLLRCIVWGNSSPHITGNLVQDTAIINNVLEGGVPIGGNTVVADPLFWDPVVDDYDLMPGSPGAGWGARPEEDEPWSDLGRALPGVSGFPQLVGFGPLTGGSVATIALTDAAPSAGAIFFMGFSDADLPLEGGTLVPDPTFILVFVTDPAGEVNAAGSLSVSTLVGLELHMQFWMLDDCATRGFSASNGLRGITQ